MAQFSDTVFKLNHSDSSEIGAVNKFAAAEAHAVNKSSDIAKTLSPVKAVAQAVKDLGINPDKAHPMLSI